MSEQAVAGQRHAGGFVAVGFVGGLLAGLFGIGGGVVLVPLMVTFLGMRQHLAHGTSLAVVAITALVAGIRYAQQGFLPPDAWVLAAELAIGTVLGVNLGARMMARLNAHRLRQVFGVFMVAAGLWLAFAMSPAAVAPADWRVDTAIPTIVLVLVMGMIVGVLSGLLGVGGGVFLVPLMVLLLSVPQHTAQAVSLAVVVPTGIFGGYAHYRRGNVQISFAVWIGLGSVLAALVGAQLAGAVADEVLRRLFGLLLAAVGVRMLWPRRDH